jgi:hypothetical protein
VIDERRGVKREVDTPSLGLDVLKIKMEEREVDSLTFNII